MDQSCEVKMKPKIFRAFIKSSYFLRPFLGILIGGIAGYLYYHFVGCDSGSCAITSSPVMSTLSGGFFGFFILNSPCSKC
jgi:LytS/YehU family sensor histidine kinase